MNRKQQTEARRNRNRMVEPKAPRRRIAALHMPANVLANYEIGLPEIARGTSLQRKFAWPIERGYTPFYDELMPIYAAVEAAAQTAGDPHSEAVLEEFGAAIFTAAQNLPEVSIAAQLDPDRLIDNGNAVVGHRAVLLCLRKLAASCERVETPAAQEIVARINRSALVIETALADYTAACNAFSAEAVRKHFG